jgi:hypothetical protein
LLVRCFEVMQNYVLQENGQRAAVHSQQRSQTARAHRSGEFSIKQPAAAKFECLLLQVYTRKRTYSDVHIGRRKVYVRESHAQCPWGRY